ncbi:MAG: hypothetical protein Kow0037_07150 [Calditrichia bacterium]
MGDIDFITLIIEKNYGIAFARKTEGTALKLVIVIFFYLDMYN